MAPTAVAAAGAAFPVCQRKAKIFDGLILSTVILMMDSSSASCLTSSIIFSFLTADVADAPGRPCVAGAAGLRLPMHPALVSGALPVQPALLEQPDFVCR